MEKIVGIYVVNIVLIRCVIEKMVVVCMVVNMGSNVMKVYLYLNDFDLFFKDVFLILYKNKIEYNWLGLI